MDDPTGPDRRRDWTDADDAAARSLRAALGDPAPAQPGERAPREVLARLERRAARHHRRRQAVALAGGAAAAAVVVAVAGLVLPPLGPLGGAQSASSGGAADSAAAEAPGRLADRTAGSAASPAEPSEPADGSGLLTAPEGPEADLQAALAVGPASMLTAADVTAFTVVVRDAAPVREPGGLALTACAEGDAGAVQPTTVWRVDLTAGAGAGPPGLVQRVAQLGSPAEVTAALAAVRAQASRCGGPGPEGTGATTELDGSPVTPQGGQALVLAATTGQGSPALRVLMATGTTLVQLEVTSDAAGAEAALAALVPTARTAVERATGGQVTVPPAAGAP